MDGQGIFTWADNRRYSGEYTEDKKHGYGCFTWPDGRQYQGLWQNGKQEGVGVYYNAKGEIRYGKWQNGKRICWIQEEEYHQAMKLYDSKK